MDRIIIRPSPTADTRSAKELVTKEQLLVSSKQHIGDVGKAVVWMIMQLVEAAESHDHTKIENIDEFFEDFRSQQKNDKEDFKSKHWWKDIHMKERHHLLDRCPEDVNLFDVLEQIADIVVAARARSGSFKFEPLSKEILEKAYENTVNLLNDNVEVVQ